MPTIASFAATSSYDISMVPFLYSTAWKRFTVGCQLMSCTPPNGSVRLQVITARSSSSFRYRVPDIRGLKKTLIAGVVLIRVRPACANSAKRSTEMPPPRPPLPAAVLRRRSIR